MNIFDELDELFESKTIKPSFEHVHIILSLYIFGKHPRGIGRYRLGKELNLGSGTVRSLMDKLKKKAIDFIEVTDYDSRKGNEQKKKGHVLTKKGLEFLKKVKQKIPLIEKGDYSIMKSIIIESESVNTYLCLVKDAGASVGNGVEQRDAAIKMDGLGATCLVYDGQDLIFPRQTRTDNDKNQTRVDEKIVKYIKIKLVNANLQLEENDVIIIGIGSTPYKARLAAFSAALTFLKRE